ncbi:MAG: 2TM domain-containing protein [Rhizomicrobium sp.]|jgi:hypothetical protein
MTYSEIDPDVQRVRYEVRRFRQHFITYVAVIGVLFIVNALTGGFWFGHWWFFWIALIWGVILALEAAHLFGDDIGREWEDRMVDQVVARRRRQAAGTAYRPYTPPEPPSAPAGPGPYSGRPTATVVTPAPTSAETAAPSQATASSEFAPAPPATAEPIPDRPPPNPPIV